MGSNKKLYGYYKAGDMWIPVLVSLGGSIIISEIPDHGANHQNDGSDEIIITGLSGLLADSQTPLAHKVSHQNDGSDEIIITGLSGLLADSQTPLAHTTLYEASGSPNVVLSAAQYYDVTGISLSVTVPTNGKVLILFDVTIHSNSTAYCNTRILRNGTQLANSGQILRGLAANQYIGHSLNTIDTPTAGTYTYKLQVQPRGGLGHTITFEGAHLNILVSI